MLTEAVINLVDIHDRLVTSLVYCAIYLTGIILVVVVDFLYYLVCLREIFIKKIKTWKKFRVVTARSKIRRAPGITVGDCLTYIKVMVE